MEPSDIGQFARRGGWLNVDWQPEDPEKYKYFFQDGGTLLIGVENDASYTLVWLDQDRRLHSISGFIYEGLTNNPPAGLVVQTPLVEVECQVKLTISETSPTTLTLTGKIALASGIGDGPVGTFTAEANPVGEPPTSA